MDGDPVTGEPSMFDSADGTPSAQITYAEMFMKICPSYMAMGMTYEQFWNCNTKVHRAFREAWELKQRYRNMEMWRQGMYIYDSLLKVAPVLRPMTKGNVKPGEYPKEPYPLTEKEAHEREEAQRIARLKRFMERLEEESKGVKSDGRN